MFLPNGQRARLMCKARDPPGEGEAQCTGNKPLLECYSSLQGPSADGAAIATSLSPNYYAEMRHVSVLVSWRSVSYARLGPAGSM